MSRYECSRCPALRTQSRRSRAGRPSSCHTPSVTDSLRPSSTSPNRYFSSAPLGSLRHQRGRRGTSSAGTPTSLGMTAYSGKGTVRNVIARPLAEAISATASWKVISRGPVSS